MFKLSKLFSWRNRQVDLSDEGAWLDLLDDFGAALLRFLIDERNVDSIPENDAALEELKQSMKRTPLATLKPTRGAVWVLFAFKDDLKGLPSPFRQDGLLLPFEWRKDGADAEGVPRGLCELSEKVRSQFGDCAADWGLSLPDYFRGRVDFDIAGATFESAWGALASGLYLALHPKVRMVAWPFSSVAFDFDRNEPTAVGELSAKIRVAASFGAEELTVAPAQFKELRRIIKSAQTAEPDNRVLKRLKPFAWKWNGDMLKSIASLVRCNQRLWSPWKKVLSANAVVVGMVAMAVLGWWWDQTRDVYEYYEDCRSDRNGVPIGVNPISRSEARARKESVCFRYQGYVRNLRGQRVRRLRERYDVDSSLRIKPGTLRTEIVLNPENGVVEEIRSFDSKDVKRCVFDRRNASSGMMTVRLFDERGHEIDNVEGGRLTTRYEVALDDNGEVRKRRWYWKDFDGYMDCDLSESGRVVKVTQHDLRGRLMRNEAGTYVTIHRNDCFGRCVESRHYDAEMKPMPDYNGILGGTNVYDRAGNVVETTFLRDGDAIAFSRQPFATIKSQYDERHRLVREEFFDEKGQPAFSVDGVHGAVREYNDNKGRVTRISYLKIDGKYGPANTSGYETLNFSYDDDTGSQMFCLRDGNGRPCVYPGGNFSSWCHQCNRQGVCVEISYYGTNGNPVACNEGYARARIACFDEDNRPREMLLWDENGNPAVTFGLGGLLGFQFENVAKIMFAYDDGGLGCVAKVYCPSAGKKLHRNVHHVRRIERPGEGNKAADLLEIQFLDEKDQLVNSEWANLARMICNYNENGDMCEIRYLRADNSPGCLTNGFSRMFRNVLHSEKGIVETRWQYNRVDEPISDPVFGVPSVRLEYDGFNRLRQLKYRNFDGTPMNGNSPGWCRVAVEYIGEKIELQCFKLENGAESLDVEAEFRRIDGRLKLEQFRRMRHDRLVAEQASVKDWMLLRMTLDFRFLRQM